MHDMQILMVTSQVDTARVWAGNLERFGWSVELVSDEKTALDRLAEQNFSILLLDLKLQGGGALGVADYAAVAHPSMNLIVHSDSSLFSDGSIFQHCSNACALVRPTTQPDDLAALVEHYAVC